MSDDDESQGYAVLIGVIRALTEAVGSDGLLNSGAGALADRLNSRIHYLPGLGRRINIRMSSRGCSSYPSSVAVRSYSDAHDDSVSKGYS